MTNSQIRAKIRAIQKQTRQVQGKLSLLARLSAVEKQNKDAWEQLRDEEQNYVMSKED